jgi:hypothetical protein
MIPAHSEDPGTDYEHGFRPPYNTLRGTHFECSLYTFNPARSHPSGTEKWQSTLLCRCSLSLLLPIEIGCLCNWGMFPYLVISTKNHDAEKHTHKDVVLSADGIGCRPTTSGVSTSALEGIADSLYLALTHCLCL